MSITGDRFTQPPNPTLPTPVGMPIATPEPPAPPNNLVPGDNSTTPNIQK